MNFPRTFCIYLDTTVDRANSFTKDAENINLSVELFNGLDGRKLKLKSILPNKLESADYNVYKFKGNSASYPSCHSKNLSQSFLDLQFI